MDRACLQTVVQEPMLWVLPKGYRLLSNRWPYFIALIIFVGTSGGHGGKIGC